MFVMSKVSICLSLFRFTVVIITIALLLACTETRMKNKFKKIEKKYAGEVPQKNPCSRSNADAEIKVPLLRTLSCERFPSKAESRSEYSHTCFNISPAAWNFLLVLISTLLIHSPTLLFSTASILNCISCG